MDKVRVSEMETFNYSFPSTTVWGNEQWVGGEPGTGRKPSYWAAEAPTGSAECWARE